MPAQFHSHHIITCEKSHQSAAAIPPPPPPPGSRLQGECVLHFTADYSKYFSLFQNTAKCFIYSQRFSAPNTKKNNEKKNKAPAGFPFLFLAKWISAARHRPDNPGDARRLLSSRSQRGSSFGTAARRLQLWPTFQSLQPQQQNRGACTERSFLPLPVPPT